MTAYSLTPEDRELLEPDTLDRLEAVLDLEEPLPDEWPYEHPPGSAVPIDEPIEAVLEENTRSWSRDELEEGET